MIKVIYNKVCGRCVQSEPLTSGMVGQTIHFEYSHDFDGLAVTAVFTDGKNTVDVVNPGNECIIPHEVLTTVGAMVKVGVYAVRGNELVIPTVYATIGVVQKGADPSGDVSADPTLPVWAQTQAMIGNLNDLTTQAKNNLVAAINEAAQSGGGGGASIELDTTLTQSGKAADAKAVGDALAGKQDKLIAGENITIAADGRTISAAGGLTTAQVNALDGMFKVCAFTKNDVSAEYNAFKTAFGITDSGGETEVTLTGISATYSGGGVPVGTAMTALTGITVTATYSDGSTATVTGYTLNGTIAEGSNTITVSYGGKTTTINVTGVADSGGESTDGTEWTNGVPYAYTLVPNEYVGIEKDNDNGFKTYNGWSRTPFLPCKGVSSITVTYIDSSKDRLTGSYACWYDAAQKYITSFAPTTANLSSVPTDACFVIISQSDAIMNNIASITPNA